MTKQLAQIKPSELQTTLETGSNSQISTAISALSPLHIDQALNAHLEVESRLATLRYQYKRTRSDDRRNELIEQAAAVERIRDLLMPVKTIRKAAALDLAATRTELASLITWAVKRTSVKQAFTEEQMYDFIDTVIADHDYNTLTIEHIAICLREGFKGRFGAIYERFDLQIVLSWLTKYSQDRDEKHRTERDNEYRANKENAMTCDTTGQYHAKIAELKQRRNPFNNLKDLD